MKTTTKKRHIQRGSCISHLGAAHAPESGRLTWTRCGAGFPLPQRPALGAPGSSDLHLGCLPGPGSSTWEARGRPFRTLDPCWSDARPKPLPNTRNRSNPAPAATLPTGVRLVSPARLLSLTSPARTADAHGSRRELGPPGLQVSARPP